MAKALLACFCVFVGFGLLSLSVQLTPTMTWPVTPEEYVSASMLTIGLLAMLTGCAIITMIKEL